MKFNVENKKFILIAISFSFLLNCKKEKSHPPLFLADSYPIKINSYWIYEVTDKTNNLVDTITIKAITEEETINGKIYKVHILQNNNIIDSGIYSINNNIIKYEGLKSQGYTGDSYFADFLLHFPFTAESNWKGTSDADIIKCTEVLNNYIVLGNTYQNVYVLKRDFHLGPGSGYNFKQTLYIVPGLGVVEHQYYLFDGAPPIDRIFSLISYNIN